MSKSKDNECESNEKVSISDSTVHFSKCCCQGPPRQEIQLAFAESRTNLNFDSLGVDDPILTIPPFSTGGQLVKIDAMAVVNFKSSAGTEFVYIIVHSLVRDNIVIAQARETGESTNFGDVTLTSTLTWVDIPPPGVHTYQTRVQFVVVPTLSIAEVQNRSLIATIIPPNQVLPSTVT